MNKFQIEFLTPYFNINKLNLSCKHCKKIFQLPDTRKRFISLETHGREHLGDNNGTN